MCPPEIFEGFSVTFRFQDREHGASRREFSEEFGPIVECCDHDVASLVAAVIEAVVPKHVSLTLSSSGSTRAIDQVPRVCLGKRAATSGTCSTPSR